MYYSSATLYCMEPRMVDLHKAVKIACAKHNTNISQIAAYMGVNRKTIYSAIRNGNPSIKTIEKIAEAFGMPVSELIRMGEE